MDATRILIEVTAGIIPGAPKPELTRRFTITDAEWEKAAKLGDGHMAHHLLTATRDRAQTYAGVLMLNPERFNWIRTEYLVF